MKSVTARTEKRIERFICLKSKAYGTREDVLLQIFLAFFLLLAQGFELLLKHDAVSLYFAQLAVGECGVVCRRTLLSTAQHVAIEIQTQRTSARKKHGSIICKGKKRFQLS